VGELRVAIDGSWFHGTRGEVNPCRGMCRWGVSVPAGLQVFKAMRGGRRFRPRIREDPDGEAIPGSDPWRANGDPSRGGAMKGENRLIWIVDKQSTPRPTIDPRNRFCWFSA